MNTSISEYSSGCESGWTTYLDQDQDQDQDQHYSYSTDLYTNYYQRKGGDDDDDEDLSMVSDASSAPPHYQNNCYAYPPSSLTYQDKTKTKSKTKTKPKPKTHKDFCLDDTASSSIFHFSQSQDNVLHSDDHNSAGHVYSAAHFENESRTKKKGLSFFKSSTKGKSSGGLLGRKRQ